MVAPHKADTILSNKLVTMAMVKGQCIDTSHVWVKLYLARSFVNKKEPLLESVMIRPDGFLMGPNASTLFLVLGIRKLRVVCSDLFMLVLEELHKLTIRSNMQIAVVWLI